MVYERGTKKEEAGAAHFTYGKMTFLHFPLALDTCTFECAGVVDVLEDSALLKFVEPKEHDDAIRKEHDLGHIVARHHGRSRLAYGRRMGRRERGGLREHRRVHEQPALARLALGLAFFRIRARASVGRRRGGRAPRD